MIVKKWDKLFQFNQPPDNPGHPAGSFDFTHMFTMNSESMKRCNNNVFCAWFRSPLPESQVYKPHVHSDDEIIGYFGSNPADPFDLGGEIEIWIDDEKHNFTKSCLLFLPAGLRHCPWFIRRVDMPIFIMFIHSTSNREGEYMVDDPKWAHLPAVPEAKIISLSDYYKHNPR